MLNGFRPLSIANQIGPNWAVQKSLVTNANYGGAAAGPSTIGAVSAGGSAGYSASVLQDILEGGEQEKRLIYRDIYYHDAVLGSAIDMLARMPFSDFSLSGGDDPEKLRPYISSVSNMRLRTMLPALSVDHMVLGLFIGSLVWNERNQIFDGLMPHSVDYAKITPVPLYGIDPIVKLEIPKEVTAAMSSTEPRMKKYMEFVPEHLKKSMAVNHTLDPSTTIYIARSGTLSDFKGVSALLRTLPIWLIEKALIRGTIDQAWKRQRGIMHVTVGDVDWQASAAELDAVTGVFKGADMDPTGAIVATRPGVNVEEIRRGDDMWNYSNITDWSSELKMRALGISLSFLNGEMSYNSSESTMSVFMEQMDAYRTEITAELFYDKTFPYIALKHGFDKEDRVLTAAVRGQDHVIELATNNINLENIDDASRLFIPKVRWHKKLRPEQGDKDYMEVLAALKEKGVPIPLQLMAAAGGLDLDELIRMQEADIETREKVKEWVDQVKQLGGGEEDEKGAGDFASTVPLTGDALATPIGGIGGVQKLGIFAREHTDELEAREFVNGKHHNVTPGRRNQITEKVQRSIAAAATVLHKKAMAKENDAHVNEKTYHTVILPKV